MWQLTHKKSKTFWPHIYLLTFVFFTHAASAAENENTFTSFEWEMERIAIEHGNEPVDKLLQELNTLTQRSDYQDQHVALLMRSA